MFQNMVTPVQGEGGINVANGEEVFKGSINSGASQTFTLTKEPRLIFMNRNYVSGSSFYGYADLFDCINLKRLLLQQYGTGASPTQTISISDWDKTGVVALNNKTLTVSNSSGATIAHEIYVIY